MITVPEVDYTRVPAPEPVKTYELSTDEGLGVYVADGRKSDSDKSNVTVQFPQWSDGTRHNPISRRRTEATAGTNNGLVLYVDNPGVELGNPRMSKDVKRALCRGDFATVAMRQWDALGEALDGLGLDFDAISRVSGASLAAHIATVAVNVAPGDVYIDRLDLWETAGLCERQSLTKFVLNFLQHGGDRWADLIQSNPDWAEELRRVNGGVTLAKLALRRTAGLAYYPMAIHRHDIVGELVAAKHRKNPAVDGDTDIVLLNGSESLVSPSEDNDRLARRLADEGLRVVRFVSEGGVHASQDNLGWYANTDRAVQRYLSEGDTR